MAQRWQCAALLQPQLPHPLCVGDTACAGRQSACIRSVYGGLATLELAYWLDDDLGKATRRGPWQEGAMRASRIGQ